jgi:hypothetical protein
MRAMFAPVPPLTGICVVCQQRVKLRKDGTAFKHTRGKRVCDGTGKQPAKKSVKRKWLSNSKGVSVRTVSGGGFESNRSRH